MKTKKITMTVPLMVSIISFIIGSICYFFIDGEIPIHWNINWQVDQTAPKEIIFLLSAAPLLLYLLLGTQRNSFTTRRGNRISVIVCVYLLVAVQWISIAMAIKPDLDVKLLFPCIIGVAMIIIGNFMPTISRNPGLGIRTPWVAKSEFSWKKTNRIGGYVISIFGVMLIVSGVIQCLWVNIIIVAALILSVLILIYLSYYYWKKDPDKTTK